MFFVVFFILLRQCILLKEFRKQKSTSLHKLNLIYSTKKDNYKLIVGMKQLCSFKNTKKEKGGLNLTLTEFSLAELASPKENLFWG